MPTDTAAERSKRSIVAAEYLGFPLSLPWWFLSKKKKKKRGMAAALERRTAGVTDKELKQGYRRSG